MVFKVWGALGGTFGFMIGVEEARDWRNPKNGLHKTMDVMASTGIGVGAGMVLGAVSPIIALIYLLQNSR